MNKIINVTSNDQGGGSTVGEMNVGIGKRKRRLWPYIVGVATIAAAIVAVLKYFNIVPNIWTN